MFFCLSGHVRSFDKWKSLYFKFHEAISTKLEMAIAYQKGSPAIMVTWHNSRVARKKSYISVFTCLMTTKLDKMMAYGIGHAQSPQVIICNLVTNKKHYISNSTRPMDTKLYRVVAYNMGPKLKTQFQLQFIYDVSLVHIFRLLTWVLFARVLSYLSSEFFFSGSKSKVDS